MSLSPFDLHDLLKSMASAAAAAGNSSAQLTGIVRFNFTILLFLIPTCLF